MGTWVVLACYLSFLYNKPYPKKNSSQKYHCYGILHASCIAQQPKSEFTSPEKSAHGVILLIYASQWIKRLRQAYHIATKTYKFGCTPHIGCQDKFLEISLNLTVKTLSKTSKAIACIYTDLTNLHNQAHRVQEPPPFIHAYIYIWWQSIRANEHLCTPASHQLAEDELHRT